MDRKLLDQSLDAFVTRLKGETSLNPSAVLYGSAARGDWVPGRSDVNLLVLIDDAAPAALRRLTPAVTAWHGQAHMADKGHREVTACTACTPGGDGQV